MTWSQMEFEHEPHPRTGITLLKSSEELIETLEDNQVQLEDMMTSKYEEVSAWQKRLSTTWSHLESIFIGSEDKVTNKKGLYETLENIQGRLSVCEKALAEYLETKRLAFPRFYFVSSVDLLDILSKGNFPTEVARHLAKLFDNMARLKFKEDSDGRPTKTALGMYSKEGEYVNFNEPCECVGQVELWLNKLMETMQVTVRHELCESVAAYEFKARDRSEYRLQPTRRGLRERSEGSDKCLVVVCVK